jgi:PQQ-like domain
MRALLPLLLIASVATAAEPITHSFLATGAETAIFDADGKAVWKYDHSTRDGWVLDSGNVLLALSKSKAHPHGAIVEVTREGKEVFTFEGTQDEVNTVQKVGKARYLLTEAGPKPRLLEVNSDGKIEVDLPLDAQTKDTHLQTRMARKLPSGNYLVPQLLDKVVREYDAKGKVVWEAKTPNMPFTAIRLENGNTLVACTHGNLLVEVDEKGKTVWELTNDDLDGKPIKDACGAQRLPNGNTVFTSYASKAKELRLIEVTKEKKVAWTYTDGRTAGIHHFQILETNGKKLDGAALR